MAQSYYKAMRASGTRYIPELKKRVEAEKMVREHFPQLEFKGFPPAP